MKKTILPALAMLIVAAVMLSTASYAWFAMSNTATATDMKVNIKTDSSFLMIADANVIDAQISGTETTAIAAVQAAATTTVPFGTVASTELYPTAHNTAEETPAYFANPANWYTKTADKATASTSTGNATPLASFDTYVLVNSFYITVAQGTTDMENLRAKVNIKHATESATDGDEAIRVLIVSTADSVELQTTTEYEDDGYANVDLGDVTSSAVVKVDVYIYYDGNDTTVYTNGIGAILPSSIDITFTADKAAAQP